MIHHSWECLQVLSYISWRQNNSCSKIIDPLSPCNQELSFTLYIICPQNAPGASELSSLQNHWYHKACTGFDAPSSGSAFVGQQVWPGKIDKAISACFWPCPNPHSTALLGGLSGHLEKTLRPSAYLQTVCNLLNSNLSASTSSPWWNFPEPWVSPQPEPSPWEQLLFPYSLLADEAPQNLHSLSASSQMITHCSLRYVHDEVSVKLGGNRTQGWSHSEVGGLLTGFVGELCSYGCCHGHWREVARLEVADERHRKSRSFGRGTPALGTPGGSGWEDGGHTVLHIYFSASDSLGTGSSHFSGSANATQTLESRDWRCHLTTQNKQHLWAVTKGTEVRQLADAPVILSNLFLLAEVMSRAHLRCLNSMHLI